MDLFPFCFLDSNGLNKTHFYFKTRNTEKYQLLKICKIQRVLGGIYF